MKCPHCDQTMFAPEGESHYVYPAGEVIILYCPRCKAILGAVNKPKD